MKQPQEPFDNGLLAESAVRELGIVQRLKDRLRVLKRENLFAMRYVRKMSQTICSSDKVTERMAEEAREYLERDKARARDIMQNAGKYQNENRLDKVIAAALAEARAEEREKASSAWKRAAEIWEAAAEEWKARAEKAEAALKWIASEDDPLGGTFDHWARQYRQVLAAICSSDKVTERMAEEAREYLDKKRRARRVRKT